MELRQLRYFLAVVDAGGFRRAARELFVDQAALSRALHQLEVELGVELLDRTPKGVMLTEPGREFVAHARTIMRQLVAAKAAMRDLAGSRTTIRIGSTAGILGAGQLTAPIFEALRDTLPELPVVFEELPFGDQVSPILAGHFDAAIVRTPIAHRDLDVIPLVEEPRALMVGAHHELAGEHAIAVTDVLREYTLPLSARADWAAFWQLDDVRGHPNPHPDAAPATTVPNMQLTAAADRTVLSVPVSMRRLAPNPLVRFVDLHDAPPSTIAIARRRGDRRPEIETFIEQAARTAEQDIELLAGARLVA